MSYRSVLVGVLALMLAGCPQESPPIHTQETYHEVVVTANGLRTGFRLVDLPSDSPSNPWTYFSHTDKPDLNCYDLSVDPNGVSRFVSFVGKDDDDVWRLRIYTGLGASIWSENPDTLDIPDPDIFASCARSRIEHLTGDLFGIIWAGNDGINSALLDTSKSPPFNLTLGDTFEHSDFELDEDSNRLSVSNASMAFFNGGLRIVWAPREKDQIKMVRGQITDGGIQLETASTFFNHSYNAISDVLATETQFFVATSDAEGITLWERSTSPNWQVYQQCENSTLSSGKLLYRNPQGDLFTLTTAGLINLTSCQTSSFVLPVRSGVISHHPGI